MHQRGTPSPEHPLVSGENSVLPGPLRPGDYSVRPPGPPVRARCRQSLVRRVRRPVPGPGPAVGSGVRWARGTTNRWVDARFVALFADAHAPNDSVEADRARRPKVLPLQGEVARRAGGGPPESPSPRSPLGVSYPHKLCAPPPELSVLCRGCLQADCSCIGGGLRPPNTPWFPGRTPSSPGPSGRGTTPYVPLDPLCGPGADSRWFAGFDGWCLVPGRLSGLGIDGLGGR